MFRLGMNQATGYASQHIWCLSQARINWECCGRKGIWHKNGGNEGGGSLISPDGVVPSRIVVCVCSDISHCTTKSRRRVGQRLTRIVSEKGHKMVVRVCVNSDSSIAVSSQTICQHLCVHGYQVYRIQNTPVDDCKG